MRTLSNERVGQSFGPKLAGRGFSALALDRTIKAYLKITEEFIYEFGDTISCHRLRSNATWTLLSSRCG